MIRQLLILILIIFLSSPIVGISTQAPALKQSIRSSISILFPFSVEAQRINKLFEADSSFSGSSLDHESFMKSMNLDVREFSLGGNTGFGVKFCRNITTTPRPSTATVDSEIDERGREEDCEYALFSHDKWRQSLMKNMRGQEMKSIFELLGWKCNISFQFCCTDHDPSFSGRFPVFKWNNNEEGYEFKDSSSVFCWPTIFKTLIGLGCLFLLIGKRWLCTIIKKRKDIKLKKEFFKRNGGLLLQQHEFAPYGGADRCKTFSSDELNKATDHFNVRRILGQGGQGTVYRGILEDGRIVAIKKSKIIDQEKLEEFINEVVILSQINHRNVVKLLGCCLETEVPILVYEFVPNGTLFQYLQDQNEEFPLTWDMRLRIATEVAGALSYLHSAASLPILHRDIKSTNILLDNKCRAKIADFGASRSIAINQTHITTRVQGTVGYLDPEYHRSNQLTDKTDVFSFGVVLVELLTGLKPIFTTSTSQENTSLAAKFVCCMKENCLYDILDMQVVMQQGKKDEIMAFAYLAKRCLNQNGKDRPTMKEVAMELEAIRVSRKKKLIFMGKLSKKWKS